MRVRRKTFYCKTNENGRLIGGWEEELADFCRQHPNKNFILRLEIQPNEPSERQTNYYWGYVVREVQGALLDICERKTLKEIDEWLRSQYPFARVEEFVNGELKSRLKDFSEFDSAEVNDYFEFLYELCSENLDLVLSDPQ